LCAGIQKSYSSVPPRSARSANGNQSTSLRECASEILTPSFRPAIVANTASAPGPTVRAVNINPIPRSSGRSIRRSVWLTPPRPRNVEPCPARPQGSPPEKNKRFVPTHARGHAGPSKSIFPMEDRTFHNVFFRLFAASFRPWAFTRAECTRTITHQPGVSYILQHPPEMSELIIALRIRISHHKQTADGISKIAHSPTRTLQAKSGMSALRKPSLRTLAREVDTRMVENKTPAIDHPLCRRLERHLNKYGEPYSRSKKGKY